MLKKSIAFMLSLILILSALPFGAQATEPTAVPETTQATQPSEAAQTTAPSQPEGEQTTQEEEQPKKLEVTAKEVPAWGKTTPPQQLRTKSARIQLLRDAIAWDFQNAQVQEEKEDLLGYCGVLASYQMYYRGINNWRKSSDGKNHFDEYSAMTMTSGGYVPQSYPAVEETQEEAPVQEQPQEETREETQEQEAPKGQTLKQVLDKITDYGTHDVYNLLVCFEKTNTQAGSIYGHVVFVYGIIDGTMYFTEGGDGFGVKAGESMECTISQFAASYDTWAEFEGIVVLGCKDYLENCASYQSDLFAGCIAATELTSLPCKEEQSQWMRNVQKGERLHVIGLYRNREGVYYYQVDDGGEIGYVPAEDLRPILYLHDSFALEEPKLPESLRTGKDFAIDGTIQSPGVLLNQVCVQILDEEGNCLQKVVREAFGEEFDLGNYQLNRELDLSTLEEGTYTCQIQAESKICVYGNEAVVDRVQTETLLEQEFSVTAETKKEETPKQEDTVAVSSAEPVEPVAEDPSAKNGWHYENETWYCYKQSQPRTGWVQSAGVTYYLKEDGSVTTGKMEVEGQERLFTATGALVTGWVKDQDGTRYLDANGVPVCGRQKIGGIHYYFSDEGFLQNKYSGSDLRQLRQVELSVTGR